MRCFTHRESEAVGTCKACSRGVCSVCAVVTEEALACSPRCAAAVQNVSTWVTKSSVRARATQKTQAVIFLVLAVLVGVVAIFAEGVGHAVCGVFAFLLLLASLRYFRLAAMWKDGPSAPT